MFKENKEFWLYIVGTILLFLLIYFTINSYKFPFVGFLLNGSSDEYTYDNPPGMAIDTTRDYRADIVTNYGTVKIDLYEKSAPVTVNNFVFLADAGFFDGVSFHRVVPGFLLQTGSRLTLDNDSSNDALGDAGYFFEDEINWQSLDLTRDQIQELQGAGYSNDLQVESRRLEKYSIAMANAGADTNSSQFFIVTAENTDARLDVLQGRHTVFGSVIGGYDVVEKINSAELENVDNDALSRPKADYYIQRVEVYIK